MIFYNKSKTTAKSAKAASKSTRGKKKEQGGDCSDAEWIMLLEGHGSD